MITLTTDFGDPYPAAMKGVIARRFADADESMPAVVDISHALPRQDVRAAAFWLRFLLPEFPPAVHCVVVDPGVGTDRKALVVRAGDHALVGPDNGVLLPPARALAAEDADIDVFDVTVKNPDSHTFHGRDVFAPVAADVRRVGVPACDRLPALSRTQDFESLSLPDPEIHDAGADGEVLVVDGFGNIVTNVPGDVVTDRYGQRIRVDGRTVPIERSYAHVDIGDPLVTVGSHENVEFAVNQGRGEEAFGLSSGEAFSLRFE